MSLPLEKLKDSKVMHLTTTGRTSGEPRTVEIWFSYQKGRVYIISGVGASANWVKNIRKDPRAKIQIKESSFAGTARVVISSREKETWDMVAGAYYRKYRWRVGPAVTMVEISVSD